MVDFVTTAKTIDEVDLTILETQCLAQEFTHYVGRRRIRVFDDGVTSIYDVPLILKRAAFLAGTEGLGHTIDTPSAWAEIRKAKPEGLKDHSTHNLFPFEGKLLPKVARALINIATQGDQTARVCDPFCGSGTVVLEAAIMSHPILANDIDPFAVWLTQAKLAKSINALTGYVETMKAASMGDHSEVLPAFNLCFPKTWVMVDCGDAVDFLKDVACDAIVTSPPYFHAIDYNFRHSEFRKRLKLGEPISPGLGFGDSVGGYEERIKDICIAMANALTKKGRIALVLGDSSGVPTSEWYELRLKEAGLRLFDRLTREYEHQSREFKQDVILIMEKA